MSVSRFLIFQEDYHKAKSLLKAIVLETERFGRTDYREYARITMVRCNLMLRNFRQAEKFLTQIFASRYRSVLSRSKNLLIAFIESNMYCEKHCHGMFVYVEGRFKEEMEYIHKNSNDDKHFTAFPFRLLAVHFEKRYLGHCLAWVEHLWPSAIQENMDTDKYWDKEEDLLWKGIPVEVLELSPTFPLFSLYGPGFAKWFPSPEETLLPSMMNKVKMDSDDGEPDWNKYGADDWDTNEDEKDDQDGEENGYDGC